MTAPDTRTPGTWYIDGRGHAVFRCLVDGGTRDFTVGRGGATLGPMSAAALVETVRAADTLRTMIGDDAFEVVARGELPDELRLAVVVNKDARVPKPWEANPDDGWNPDFRSHRTLVGTVRLIVAPEPRTKRVPLAQLMGETLPGGEVVDFPFFNTASNEWRARLDTGPNATLTVHDDGTVDVLDTADPS